MKHELAKHKNCTIAHCNICEGGLAFCEVCKGGEGSLPTDCPGRKMTEQEEARVYAGEIDYRGDRWVNPLVWFRTEVDRLKKLAFDAQADAGLQRSERDKWKHAADIERARVDALEADISEEEIPPCLHDETKFCRVMREKDYWRRTSETNRSAVEEAHEREDETKARVARLDDELEKWPDDVAEALGDDYHGRDGEDVLTATRRIVSGLQARVAELEEASTEIVIPPGATNPCPDCRGSGEIVFIEAGMTGPVSRSHRTETCKTCDGLGVVLAARPSRAELEGEPWPDEQVQAFRERCERSTIVDELIPNGGILNDEQRRTFREALERPSVIGDEPLPFVIPRGAKRCPDCNGSGHFPRLKDEELTGEFPAYVERAAVEALPCLTCNGLGLVDAIPSPGFLSPLPLPPAETKITTDFQLFDGFSRTTPEAIKATEGKMFDFVDPYGSVNRGVIESVEIDPSGDFAKLVIDIPGMIRNTIRPFLGFRAMIAVPTEENDGTSKQI